MPILPRVPPRAVPSMTAKNWAPVSYTSEVTNIQTGQTRIFPQSTIQSGFNTPYYIDEIRMTAYTGEYDNTEGSFPGLASVLYFQFYTGSYYFSQGVANAPSSVPMCLYAPTYSGLGQYETTTQFADEDQVAQRTFITRRWVLPKPLWMNPGDLLQATVSRDPVWASDLGAVTAQVTVIGRAVPPHTQPPVKRCIPHVGWFGPAVYGTTTLYQETVRELENPFKSTWHVQRMIGTTRTVNSEYMTPQASTVVQNTVGIFPDPSGTNPSTLLRITDSLGYKITGSAQGGFVPFSDVVSPNNNSAWTFNRPIAVDENINVAIQVTGGGSTATYDTLISLVGYREE